MRWDSKESFERYSREVLNGELKVKRSGLRRRRSWLYPHYKEEDLPLDYSWEPTPIGVRGVSGPDLLIIIPTYNCWEITRMCLRALEDHRTVPYRVVVVDNGSTDGTAQHIERMNCDWITLLQNRQNLGFTKAVNQGLALAEPDEDVVLMNDDVIVTAHWAEGMGYAAWQEERVGVVACRMKSLNGRIHHAGSVMRRNFIGDTNLWGQELPDSNLYAGRWNPPIVMFSCAYFPAPALRALGHKLDEAYFAYYEDSDTCYRLREAGFSIVYDGSVEVVHHHNATTRHNEMDFESIFNTSRTTFADKWARKEGARLADNPVVVRGYWHGVGGYCSMTREFVRALDLNGVPVWLNEPLLNAPGYGWTHEPVEENHTQTTNHLEALAVDDPTQFGIVVNFSIPAKWVRVPEDLGNHLNIGYTMLEVDGIPDSWTAACNSMDAMLVPTDFNTQTFRSSGVRVPIRSVPAAVNTQIYHPDVRPLATDGKTFKILSVFQWGERKGPEILLEAVGRAAKSLRGVDIELVLKTASDTFDYATVVAEAARVWGLKIQVLQKAFPPLLMPSLYASCDLFVLPTRGEGFGMPIAEAMACGLPVVATDCSSVGTFLDDSVGYPVNWRYTDAISLTPYYDGFKWAEPDMDHLISQIKMAVRDVEKGRPRVQKKVEGARQRVLERFSYGAVARDFKAAIHYLYQFRGQKPPGWCGDVVDEVRPALAAVR